MKYNKHRERWELTDTEMLKRLREGWERKRDALPLDDTDSFHYFNGGVNALSDLLMDLIHGDRNACK
jgi:hypothetical protein